MILDQETQGNAPSESKTPVIAKNAPWKPGKSGNPKGRPIGSGNKFATLKQELAENERRFKIIRIFDRMLEGSKREQMEALKIACNLLPREDKLQHEIAQVILNKTVVQECPKCKARQELEQGDKTIDVEPSDKA